MYFKQTCPPPPSQGFQMEQCMMLVCYSVLEPLQMHVHVLELPYTTTPDACTCTWTALHNILNENNILTVFAWYEWMDWGSDLISPRQHLFIIIPWFWILKWYWLVKLLVTKIVFVNLLFVLCIMLVTYDVTASDVPRLIPTCVTSH